MSFRLVSEPLRCKVNEEKTVEFCNSANGLVYCGGKGMSGDKVVVSKSHFGWGPKHTDYMMYDTEQSKKYLLYWEKSLATLDHGSYRDSRGFRNVRRVSSLTHMSRTIEHALDGPEMPLENQILEKFSHSIRLDEE